MIYENILATIGNTPLVKINQLNLNPKVMLAAKLEFFNPGGSIKDRIGPCMITKAEKDGKLKKGGTIVEPTSGNMGVGLALTAAVKGYKTIFVMPDKMSQEKVSLLRAYGSKVIITPTAVAPEDPSSYYKVSDKLAVRSGAYKPDQYNNPANPEAHYRTTGPEIWRQTKGKITHLVAGLGTGGTISGIAKYLKGKNQNIKIIGADPVGSIFYEYFKTGKIPKFLKTYKTEGVGEDFLPKTIDFSLIDEVVRVSDKDSFMTARSLARKEGILVGGSSGLALFAARRIAKRIKQGLIVVILPDSGRNYLSKIFNDEWMISCGFISKKKNNLKFKK